REARPGRRRAGGADGRIRSVGLSGQSQRRTSRRHTIIVGSMTIMTNPTVNQLITRSNPLGADQKNTNYAGGNTSAKGAETDPVTGEPVELLWVKGSGGDLGTLTENG